MTDFFGGVTYEGCGVRYWTTSWMNASGRRQERHGVFDRIVRMGAALSGPPCPRGLFSLDI